MAERAVTLFELILDIQPVTDPATGECLGFVGKHHHFDRVMCQIGDTEEQVIERFRSDLIRHLHSIH